MSLLQEARLPLREQLSAGSALRLLFFGYLLAYGDRVVFGLLLKPIQQSLHLTDSGAGLLSSLAFDRVYGVPLAMAAIEFSLTAGITSIAGCF